MRIRTRTDTVYTFDELDDDTQQKVMEKIAQQNMEWYDASDLTYQFEQVLEPLGFPTDDINWSLSWSQGDGVAFYGTFDVYVWLRTQKLRTKFRRLLSRDMYIGCNIERTSYANFYSHENTMHVELTVDHEVRLLTQKEEILASELRELVCEAVIEMSRFLERMGYDEFRYLTSEEYIKEQIEINGYEFTWEGDFA
jgi:hypothetical protein